MIQAPPTSKVESSSNATAEETGSSEAGWLGFGFVAGFAAAWFLLSYLSPPPATDQAAGGAQRTPASEKTGP